MKEHCRWNSVKVKFFTSFRCSYVVNLDNDLSQFIDGDEGSDCYECTSTVVESFG